MTPAVCSNLQAEGERSSVCHGADNEHDALSAEKDSLLRADEVASISNAQPSQEVLGSVTVPATSLPDLGEDGPAIVNMSTLKVLNVLDRRSGPSGDQYKCALEPMWFAADLAEKAQMGDFHIRAYKNGLVRARRLSTLRSRKRTLKEMEAF